jgi:hypothetical protein
MIIIIFQHLLRFKNFICERLLFNLAEIRLCSRIMTIIDMINVSVILPRYARDAELCEFADSQTESLKLLQTRHS